MGDVLVSYHCDGFGPHRPAIDVKDYNIGHAYAMAGQALYDGGGAMPDLIGVAYDRIVSDFWQAAEEIAAQRGLGAIEQEGRSGGWLVFTDFDPETHPSEGDDDQTVPVWLTNYAAMQRWVDAFIADAPRKVRDLAQQYAMDEAGEDAARRMFAFEWERMPYRQLMRITAKGSV